MKPAPFRYVRPEAREEAVEVLARYGEESKILAGGQSLVPMMNLRLARPCGAFTGAAARREYPYVCRM